LLRKFHEAKIHGEKEVVVWGTGTPRREFLHVDDLADAAVFLMQCYEHEEMINVGTGEDIPIRDLAELTADVIGYKREIVFDVSKPDGTMQKLLDVSRLHALGWRQKIGLREGIGSTYSWYVRDFRGTHPSISPSSSAPS
jgi:GDP-L-fucose synthase